jgi:hypothetical protein
MGVQPEGDIIVRFRAGKEREAGAKPRPLIVQVTDDETRVSLLRNAPKLARAEETKRIYVSPDLTPQQRDEERKKEVELQEKADKQTKEKKGGEGKKFVVVGTRGKRRIIEVEDRGQQRQ